MHERLIGAWKWMLGATIEDANDLPPDRVAETDFATRRIRLSVDLTPVERDCTAMHELAHLAFGVPPTGVEVVDALMEREADEWAAVRLIPIEVLEHALASPRVRDPRDVAEFCGVDQNILRAAIRINTREGRVLRIPRARMPLARMSSEDVAGHG